MSEEMKCPDCEAQLVAAREVAKIPTKTLEALQRWIAQGTHPDHLGSFVRAVLTNDRRAAVFNADDENLANLSATVSWVYMLAPGGACGSREKLVAYHELHAKKRVA